MKYFILYIIFINILSAVVCVADKNFAKKGRQRVSEKTLFTLSFLGGSVFMYLTMLKIRHKTKHRRFMIGLPVLIILQILFVLLTKELL